MTPDAADKVEAFFGRFKESRLLGKRPVLLLDYDGTMAGFRVNRFDARPWAGVRELLARIQEEGSTRMAVITGRPSEEIGTMLALEAPVEVWGLHGAERLHADGRKELEAVEGEARRELNAVRERLKRDALGGLYEDKANAAVMHWRGRTAQDAAAIERATRKLFEPLAKLDGLSLLEFEAGLELRMGRDKGGAVKAVLAEQSRQESEHGPVSYLGDDLTDESAFRQVNATKGAHLSVLMRRKPRETSADVWMKPPEDLRLFLRRWLAALG